MRVWPVALVGGVFLLAACGGPFAGLKGLENNASRNEWMAVPLHNAWIYAPNARLLVMRNHGHAAEQKIGLSNQTSLLQDNFIYLRTIPRQSPGVMQLRTILEQSGGLPSPFTESDLQVMRAAEDSAGALIWAEWTNGAGTTCVLAMRRLTVTQRVLPQGTGALDVLMRNCVRGTTQQALAPVGPEHVVTPASARLTQGTPQRSLSPLAAPAP